MEVSHTVGEQPHGREASTRGRVKPKELETACLEKRRKGKAIRLWVIQKSGKAYKL